MTVVLLHDLGDPVGGARWRSAAPPDWIIPDLPGHGSTPAVRTGHYDPMSAVAIARWTLAHQPNGTDASTLVGVGHNAHSALVGAAGGDCDRVVVVDGLWGPWRGPGRGDRRVLRHDPRDRGGSSCHRSATRIRTRSPRELRLRRDVERPLRAALLGHDRPAGTRDRDAAVDDASRRTGGTSRLVRRSHHARRARRG